MSCVLLAGCGEAPPTEPVAFATLGEGTSYQPGCGERHDDRLIRDALAWESYWNEVHPGTPPARPSVDFTAASVLTTCGARPSPGFSDVITEVGVVEDAPVALVTVTDYTPGPNCASPAVVIYGHHAVRVDRVLESADFTHEAATGPPC